MYTHIYRFESAAYLNVRRHHRAVKCIKKCMYASIYIYVCIYIYICLYEYIFTQTHTHLSICLSIYLSRDLNRQRTLTCGATTAPSSRVIHMYIYAYKYI